MDVCLVIATHSIYFYTYSYFIFPNSFNSMMFHDVSIGSFNIFASNCKHMSAYLNACSTILQLHIYHLHIYNYTYIVEYDVSCRNVTFKIVHLVHYFVNDLVKVKNICQSCGCWQCRCKCYGSGMSMVSTNYVSIFFCSTRSVVG